MKLQDKKIPLAAIVIAEKSNLFPELLILVLKPACTNVLGDRLSIYCFFVFFFSSFKITWWWNETHTSI